jgi:hypothetical protein
MSTDSKKHQPTAERLRAEHRREHREHLDWQADLDRWREEFAQAILAYVRGTAPQLEIESYEEALDAHEIAIDAHEETMQRHEALLRAESQGGPVTSDEMSQFQDEIEERHNRSREKHKLLEITHRAILQALRMLTESGE